MKYYIAYGSNLNMVQMLRRCPKAKPVMGGDLLDHQLVYRGSHSGNYATIIPAKGKAVPVGVWKITKSDEDMLDLYEGYPRFYQKHTLPVVLEDGRTIEGMVYIMRPDATPGKPTQGYVDIIREGYEDFGLEEIFLMASLLLNRKETEK